MIDVQKLRKDFPILKRTVRDGKRLVYLDNAATSQKPQVVIDALTRYYTHDNANIHRAVHELSEVSSTAYEAVRRKVQKFLKARLPQEVIFTKNTTEAINLVAFSWGRKNLKEGDEILVSEMEHHSNLIPWQILAKESGAKLRFIPVTREGELDLRNLKGLLTEKTKLLAVVQVSNFLGTINDLEELTKLAKRRGAKVLIDAAQSAPHLTLEVNKLRADFLAFSAHKMLGPMGVGVLYVRKDRFSEMEPFLTGGGMIRRVGFKKASFAEPPGLFEAGTPNVAGVIAFGQALEYLETVGLKNILQHERELTGYFLERLSEIQGVKVYGPKDLNKRVGVVSFSLKGIHSHDLATVLDEEGVAIRSGHHCVQPLHAKYGVNDSARVSFYLYNTKEEVEVLLAGIRKAKKLLGI